MSQADFSRQMVILDDQISDEDCPTVEEFDSELPPDLEFTAVPRQPRKDGLTPQRQRIFIKLVAACGSVKLAAKAIQISQATMYKVRQSPGAESFAAAWDKAVGRGARRVLDVMIDHAINGVPEKVYQNGQIVAERRRFNTRAQMWIVAHNFPEKYAVTGGLMHSASGPVGLKRLKEAWKREWSKELRAQEPDIEDVRAEILRRLDAINGSKMREWYDDPQKRAAYELLHGAQDWEQLTGKSPRKGFEGDGR